MKPLSLTPEVSAHCYEMVIAASPTLQGWNLPGSDDIKFMVVSSKRFYGRYKYDGGTRIIEVSKTSVRTFPTLVCTIIHEIVHLHQCMLDIPVADDLFFDSCADRLCKELMLDRGTF